MKLFEVTLLAERGLNCDCCVSTVRATATVYAEDEAQARELIARKDPLATVKIESLECKGEVEHAPAAGILMSSASEIFRGYHGDSPLRKG